MTQRARPLLKSGLSLGLVAIIGTTLLSGVNRLTEARIAEQERRVILEQLGQIIGPAHYDNSLQDDWFAFSDEDHFPQGQRVVAYRAWSNGKPVAVILRFAAVDGYNGSIGLLLGIEADGRIAGVRVTTHRETPGLGDVIEAAKSDWIRNFDGKSLDQPALDDWEVRRDGGVFDQFTGATITPRAVVKAVRMALQYHEGHRDELYNAPSQGASEADP
jgi:electron transport complex protein RnfG